MPTDLPNRSGPDLGSPHVQAALLTDALASNDAFIVSRALHDIAEARGQRHGFGDDPRLSVVLAAIAALGLDLSVKPRG